MVTVGGTEGEEEVKTVKSKKTEHEKTPTCAETVGGQNSGGHVTKRRGGADLLVFYARRNTSCE
jgi:hypothetical protein